MMMVMAMLLMIIMKVKRIMMTFHDIDESVKNLPVIAVDNKIL